MNISSEMIVADLADELGEVLKADSPHAQRSLSTPLLDICTDGVVPGSDSDEDALSRFLRQSISAVLPATDQGALSHLFLGPDRWQPLATRGPRASEALGISYDTLRRRDRNGVRRLDLLVEDLAKAAIATSALDDLLGTERAQNEELDPGTDVFDRASVFLSYSTADDEHEGGLVASLRDQLVSEFRFQTGQELFVFLDKKHINLGENWQRRLDTGIRETTLLLVLLTPSYLHSKHCRSELTTFLEREAALGRDDLVLPVYYATVTDDDPLASAILKRQYVDWRDLRFQPLSSVPVRAAVAQLSSSVIAALARSQSPQESRTDAEPVDESPGLVERIAELQLALPRFVRNMYRLTEEQEGVTAEVQQATTEIQSGDDRGLGGAARLITTRRLATRLTPYAERMETAAAAIEADLDRIDQGVAALAGGVPASEEEGIEEAISELITNLSDARSAGEQTAAAIESMAKAYSDVGKKTSTLRPVLTRMVAAVRVVGESGKSFAKWQAKFESALEKRRAKTEVVPSEQ